jgi:drug/metabolite transporter (DMT)-like permease
MLLATVLIWGFNFTVTKYVLDHGFAPLAYASVRYTAAALLFAGLTYGLERTLTVERRDVPLLLGAAALGIWLNQVTYVYAIELTTAATTALIFGITPVLVAAAAFLVGLERLSPWFWVAAAISVGGAGLVAAGGGGDVSTNLAGDLLAFGGAATWAAYSVAIAPLMRRYSPFRISSFVLLAGCVPLLVSAATQLLEQDFSLEPLVWLALAFALLGPLVLTNILWFTAIDRVGPSRAALFANLTPFFGAAFALLLLSETMTLLQVVGGFAIVGGIALARGQTPPEPPAD